jgi:hypothetical protein
MQTKLIILSAVTSLSVAGVASAAIQYDAFGYEVPSSGFAFVGLEGQGGGSRPLNQWGFSGTAISSNVTVAADIGVAGTDGVVYDFIDRVGANDAGNIAVIASDAPAERPTAPVVVSTAINVLGGVIGNSPFFGLSTFATPVSSTSQVPIITDVFISSTDGSVFVNDGTPLGVLDSGVDVPLGVYNDFSLVLDYDTKTYDLSINGSPSGTFPFRGGQGAFSADADALGRPNDFFRVGFAAEDTGLATTEIAATAYYDDLVVAIPEPATAGLLGLAGLVTLRRRR